MQAGPGRKVLIRRPHAMRPGRRSLGGSTAPPVLRISPSSQHRRLSLEAGRICCSTFGILVCMTTPIPTRFSDNELAVIDRLVAEGVGQNRSDVVRQAVGRLDEAVRRERTGQAIADSYRIRPQTQEDNELAMANAIAMTEAEPW